MKIGRRRLALLLGVAVALAVSVVSLVLHESLQDHRHEPKGLGLQNDDVSSARPVDVSPSVAEAGSPASFEVGKHSLLLHIDCGSLPHPPQRLYLRSEVKDVTTVHDVPPAQEHSVVRMSIPVNSGRYTISFGREYRASVRVVEVDVRGYAANSSKQFKPLSEPLIIQLSMGYSLRVLTLDDDGKPVAGRLSLTGADTGEAKAVLTDGEAILYGQNGEVVDLQFRPTDNELAFTTHRFEPPDDFVGKYIVLTLMTHRLIRTRVHFVGGGERGDAGERFVVQLTRPAGIEEKSDGEEVVVIRLRDGEQLDNDDFPLHGKYTLRWVLQGRLGQPVDITRAELAKLESVYLQAPIAGQSVVIYVKDTEGLPVRHMELDVTYQGAGYQRVRLLTNEEGAIVLPDWDRDLFQLVIRPPRGVRASPPGGLMNPENGATIVVDASGLTERVRINLTSEPAALKGIRAQLELWAHPDATLGDWQVANFANGKPPTVTFDGTGTSISVPDHFSRISFERSADIRVVLVVGGYRLTDWPLHEFLTASPQAPVEVAVNAASLSRKHQVRFAEGSGHNRWVLGHGLVRISQLVAALNRVEEDRDWSEEYGFSTIEPAGSTLMHVPDDCKVLSGMDSTGRFAIFKIESSGDGIVAAIETELPGATVAIHQGAQPAERCVAIGSFYQIVRDGQMHTLYWNEDAISLDAQSLPIRIVIPRNTPLLVLPLKETFGLTTNRVILTDFVHRPRAGTVTTVRLQP